MEPLGRVRAIFGSMDTQELLNLAERCMRLARAETNLELARKLKELSEDYLARAKSAGPSQDPN